MKLLLASALCALVIFFPSDILTFTSGPPATGGIGNTGGTRESGQTCARSGCHAGTPAAQAGLVSVDAPATGWLPDSTYDVTVSITEAGRNKFGFQLSAQDASGNLVGSFNPVSGTTLNQGYIQHTSSGTSGSGGKTWNFSWTAPASLGDGTLDFFVAVNASNSNGSASGDLIYVDSTSVVESTVSSISPMLTEELALFPNPSSDQLVIYSESALSSVQVFNAAGQVMHLSPRVWNLNEWQVEIHHLPAGTYILRTNTGHFGRFVKQ